jgi:hypothetical protein
MAVQAVRSLYLLWWISSVICWCFTHVYVGAVRARRVGFVTEHGALSSSRLGLPFSPQVPVGCCVAKKIIVFYLLIGIEKFRQPEIFAGQ